MKGIVIALLAILLTACTVPYNGKITGNAVSSVSKGTCVDSDGGIKENIPGDVSGMSERNEDYKLEDECYDKILTEFYCDKNVPKSRNINCESNCRSGTCTI